MTDHEDILQQTLSGLEAGLHVRHIATFPLQCWFDPNQTEAALREPSLLDFDQIPVRQDGRVVGVIERDVAEVRDVLRTGRFRPLDDSILASAEEPLMKFLKLAPESPYRLVVFNGRIEGMVTRSDILKLPVRIAVFTLITHLEAVMAQLIEHQGLEPNEWLEHLQENRRELVKERHQQAAANRLNPSLVEFTEFGDKRRILKKLLMLGNRFDSDLWKIEGIRNTVAHAGNYAETDDQLRAFVNRIELAEYWIDCLSQVARESGEGNSK